VARVDREICIACGICCDICAEGAMALVDEVAVVSPERCTGCGDCLDPCPGQAISLAPRSRR
jgi:heterodisulfide reductase subunit A-like polyferredoxin